MSLKSSEVYGGFGLIQYTQKINDMHNKKKNSFKNDKNPSFLLFPLSPLFKEALPLALLGLHCLARMLLSNVESIPLLVSDHP